MHLHWTPFIVASISACAAVVAAIVAAVSASRTRRREAATQHIRDLEGRLADRKYAIYEPMIDLFTKIIDPATAKRLDPVAMGEEFARFDAWVAIFGSDAAVTAWHHFRQAVFSSPPPAAVMRLYGDFVLAARRDMGRPDTTASVIELVGTRIKDLYDSDDGTALKEVISS